MTRLSPGTLIVGIFAVLFGLVAAYAVKQHLQNEPEPIAAAEPQRQVVPLASGDLTPGRTLTMGDVMLIRMTRDEFAKKGLPAQFMSNPEQVIGRVLREPVEKGKAFVPTMFYPEGFGPSVAERLKPGYRAITVPLKENAVELGLVSPGMDVDVVFRTAANAAEKMPETTVTLLERVEVLAIGRDTFPGARASQDQRSREPAEPTVTLAVTPEQAGALKVVEGHGTMSLVACGPDDALAGDPGEPQTLAGLLNLPRPQEPFTTQAYRGGRLTTNVFENGRQTAIAEMGGGLPVAANSSSAAIQTVSHRVAKAATPEEESTCGCQDK